MGREMKEMSSSNNWVKEAGNLFSKMTSSVAKIWQKKKSINMVHNFGLFILVQFNVLLKLFMILINVQFQGYGIRFSSFTEVLGQNLSEDAHRHIAKMFCIC